jgi:acylphosphatase
MQIIFQKVHKNIRVLGRVQGVGFRFACRKMAISYGISGFVKNMYDGSVYIEAEGSEADLSRFIDWCHKGPPYASIDEVRISDGNVKGFRYFDITG